MNKKFNFSKLLNNYWFNKLNLISVNQVNFNYLTLNEFQTQISKISKRLSQEF